MTVVAHHHPFTRAASIVSMLEEVETPYELKYIDIMTGEQKQPSFLELNPMGKVPVIQDGEVIISEVAAIGLYLADRYASERLAPALDDPARGAYLRWSLFGPSVIEPAAYMAANNIEYGAGQAGWGEFQAMQATLEHAIGDGP
ncbi:MAG: glutathione S-transferase, partial [Myxococcota bacterium]